ncbi:Tlg2-vesicle protein of 38 kDa [Pleurostoma richardsiae]|uniref:Golgi apparatus membrane protein TVP38 n=1 Tax=Pleurostoma richardsiae TaxID=41990 RepID=A0AA38RW99_9PEZI|nr:Tlg2-vesicle protein of 38 kDa [Pleurostoma richardsiae]
MPADYRSAAAALSLSPSPSPVPSPSSEDAPVFRRSSSRSPPAAPTLTGSPSPLPRPQWASSGAAASAGRLSAVYTHHRRSSSFSSARHLPLHTQLLRTASALLRRALALFYRLTPLQRVLVCAALAVVLVLAVLGLVFSHAIFGALAPIAQGWRRLPGGWLIVFVITAATGFPPLVGYSSACTLAGFVYGFPLGWPIVAAASVVGSLGAFYTSRTVFSGYVHRLVGRDRRFVALGQVLRRDGLGVLALVRFCPLPFSLSNGFLATIPSVSPLAFAVATALASPKLLVHVFIGSRLALLAEKGDKMSAGDRAINYVSMLVGGLVGVGVGYVIYRRTMARAAELAREEADEAAGLVGEGDGGVGAYADRVSQEEDARLMGDEDAAALMDDDDISLWDTADGVEGGGYRDTFADGDGGFEGKKMDEEEAIQGLGRK